MRYTHIVSNDPCKPPDTLEQIARREIEAALFEMPDDVELPKHAIVALCIQSFVRGASWHAGVVA